MNAITPLRFYKMYFNQLRTSKTKIEAFNYVNNNVRLLTGNMFYKSYKHFTKGKLNN
jgi:hypothetical protein